MKVVEGLEGQTPGLRVVARLEKGLAAADLLRGVVHLDPEGLEHPQGASGGRGPELVHQAGDEDMNAHGAT